MSTWLLSKVDIDALITIALRRTESSPLPVAASGDVPQRITAANATEVGRRLWMENWRANSWMYEDEIDESRAIEESIRRYAFEEVPGEPLDGAALKIVRCFGYQTLSDESTEEGTYGTEFYDAMIELCTARLGSDLGEAFTMAAPTRLPGGWRSETATCSYASVTEQC